MFAYPPATRFGKAVPKTRIHAAASSNKRIRELFTAQVSDILWAHKLSPETLHLPARHGIAEIQVFSLHLKSETLDPAILRTLDKAIPFPLLYEIHHGGRIRFAASYKRPSDADSAKWVIEGTFLLDWQAADIPRLPLPVALDLSALHDQLIRQHLKLPARPNESLRDHVARVQAIETKLREASQLEAKLQREPQFNRKVELNQRLRALSAELASLGHGLRQPAAAFPEPACWPGSQGHDQEKPEGSSFTDHTLPAAGCVVESGSRLPQSKVPPQTRFP